MPDLLKRIIHKAVGVGFKSFERMGIHVTPIVYDSPIPETKDLTDQLFKKRSDCVGLNWNVPVQRRYLNDVFRVHVGELEFQETPTYSLVDSAVLHSMIRHHKPKKIVEIGSGETTLIAANSCRLNTDAGGHCDLVAIDPYPKDHLRNRFPPNVRLVEKQVQDVAVEDIIDCDLLFIDSSHVIKIGGDVNYEILEIIPRLKSGTLVHWHDILLPGEYWQDWVKDKHYIWTEQYLLHAFLKFNNEFEILWASHFMQLSYPDEISEVFPNYRPNEHRITSFWIRRN